MSQLKRDGLISSWFDGEILAGDSLDSNIDQELDKQIFFWL